MERKQFTFYRSFMDGIKRIKDETERCEAYDAIVAYALDGIEPDLDELSDTAALAFILSKPNLDASRKKAEAGQKGGESKAQANSKQTASKTKANGKREREREREQDREQMLKESTKEKRTVFKAPTVEAVAAYIREKGYPIDAQHFVDYYQRQGWKLSNGQPMKDWQSAVRLWSRDKKPKKNYYGDHSHPDERTLAAVRQLMEEEAQYEEEGA